MAWGSHVPSFLAFWKRRIGTESQSSPRPEMVAYRSRMWPSEWAMAPASLVRRCSVLLRGQLDGVERFSSLRPTERRWCRRACRDIAPRTQALGRRDADEEPGRRDRDRRAGESNPQSLRGGFTRRPQAAEGKFASRGRPASIWVTPRAGRPARG